MRKDEFTVTANDIQYSVRQLQACNPRKYRIKNNGNYLFTIHETAFNGWLIDDINVYEPGDLADSIGHQINLHEKP